MPAGPMKSPFTVQRALCRVMCPQPRLAPQPIYGFNDWYYAYGNNNAARILEDCHRLVSLSPSGPNPPFSVIDDGWQSRGREPEGPWTGGNARFGSMEKLAEQMREAGVRPGIWVRPLAGAGDTPAAWRLNKVSTLDPTVPEVKQKIAADIARLRQWGYQLIKHDYTTYDILGRWGPTLGATLTDDGWSFKGGRTQTTAEVIRELYQTIRAAAGEALLIGCNTVSHLSAGVFEANRIGDDTSGRDWDRTRRMGVNSLAFRAAHHGTFYAVDGDCVGLTRDVPWELNRQWLNLLARSGTALFVSAQKEALGPEQEKALREAFAVASVPQPLGEPLDWMESTCPRRWRFGGETVEFHWMGPAGASPFPS